MAENEGENDFDFKLKEEFTAPQEETTEETKEKEVVEEVVDEAPKDETSALEEKEVETKHHFQYGNNGHLSPIDRIYKQLF